MGGYGYEEICNHRFDFGYGGCVCLRKRDHRRNRQLVQHEALDAATQGFKDALTEKMPDVKFDEQNAAGDAATCVTITSKFAADGVDLILANATSPLQAAVSATGDIPILGTSITDYATALGMKEWNGTTGINVSGTSDLAPLDGQAAMIQELFPDAKNIGLLYCSAGGELRLPDYDD